MRKICFRMNNLNRGLISIVEALVKAGLAVSLTQSKYLTLLSRCGRFFVPKVSSSMKVSMVFGGKQAQLLSFESKRSLFLAGIC